MTATVEKPTAEESKKAKRRRQRKFAREGFTMSTDPRSIKEFHEETERLYPDPDEEQDYD